MVTESSIKMDYNQANTVANNCSATIDELRTWRNSLASVLDGLRTQKEPSVGNALMAGIEIINELDAMINSMESLGRTVIINAKEVKEAQERVLAMTKDLK